MLWLSFLVEYMFLTQYTPHLLTAVSLFLAIFLHARQTTLSLWGTSWRSAFASAFVAVLVIFVVHDNYLNFEVAPSLSEQVYAFTIVAMISFTYSLVLALLVGYVIKLAPSFFD